jgi:hypothetical protein
VTTTTQSYTVATASNFNFIATGQNGRMSCEIQYNGTTTGFVFFGNTTTPAIATTKTSFQVKPQGYVYCENDSGSGSTVDQNPIWVTGATGEIFVIKIK